MLNILIFTLFLLTDSVCAQNVNSSPIQANLNNKKETPNQKPKKPAQYQNFDDAIAKLTPLQRKKFSEINNKYFQELTKNNNEYQKKYKEISKGTVVVMNFNTIFSKQEPKRDRGELPENIKAYNQKVSNEYKKLTPDQRKKIKQEAIIYRKAMNRAQKERRIALKNLLKEDFEMFKESEDVSEIINDEKLEDMDLPEVNNPNEIIKKK